MIKDQQRYDWYSTLIDDAFAEARAADTQEEMLKFLGRVKFLTELKDQLVVPDPPAPEPPKPEVPWYQDYDKIVEIVKVLAVPMATVLAAVVAGVYQNKATVKSTEIRESYRLEELRAILKFEESDVVNTRAIEALNRLTK